MGFELVSVSISTVGCIYFGNKLWPKPSKPTGMGILKNKWKSLSLVHYLIGSEQSHVATPDLLGTTHLHENTSYNRDSEGFYTESSNTVIAQVKADLTFLDQRPQSQPG